MIGFAKATLAPAAVLLVCGFLYIPVFAQEMPAADKRSGYAFMSRDTQEMQDDDTANPAILWVLDGEALWSTTAGPAGKSCADCHGDAAASMKGVAARYPAFDPARAQPLTLEGRISICRTDRQQATPFKWESRELLALAAFVGRQSRGVFVAPPADERLKPFLDAGRRLYSQRQGQLNLSCGNCHDDNWDKRLAGNAVTQAHPTGYPIYRLEWQGLGSLQRRLRNCLFGMRAEPYAFGSLELTELELYLMWRARGLAIETPAVRP
jgi:L-cysteine S-thiosulfotransferase